MAVAMGARFKRWKGSDKWFTADGKIHNLHGKYVTYCCDVSTKQFALDFRFNCSILESSFPFQKSNNNDRVKSVPEPMLTIYVYNKSRGDEYQIQMYSHAWRVLFTYYYFPFSCCHFTVFVQRLRQSAKMGKIERNMKQRHSKSLDMCNAANGAQKIHSWFQKFICCLKMCKWKKRARLKREPSSSIRYTNITEREWKTKRHERTHVSCIMYNCWSY